MKHTDLIIIGGGPGGYEDAAYAAAKGVDVTLIEASRLGGTCLNVGCIPTKCLCHSAEIADMLKAENPSAAGFGQLSSNIDFSKIMERKNAVVETLRNGLKESLRGVNIVMGKASFVRGKDKTVSVALNVGENGENTVSEYRADNIIVATGSVPKRLPIPGIDCEGVLTSTEMLAIDHIPASLCVMGGGVVGMEFASIFSSFGTKVSVVEFLPEILPNFDKNIVKRLRQSLKGKGIDFHLKSAVTGIEPKDGGLTVSYKSDGGKTGSLDAEVVLSAVGRAANTASLNLDDAGIEYTRAGITTGPNYETNVPGIYAVGDINGRMQLAHVAKYQGIHVVNHLLGKDDSVDFGIVPSAVFTSPTVAMVGQTEEQLKKDGVAYKAYKSFYRANGKALAEGQSDGMLKVLSDASGKILGVHILGANAADMIHEAATLMNFSATVDDVRRIIHAHPTLSELFSMAVGS